MKMELSKHNNHRNVKYLNWLRKQNCIIAGREADVTHHVNMGTNSGKGLKASDYFCIPLLNEFHTTGLWAVHSIGEISFFENFKLDRDTLFIDYLYRYSTEVLKVEIDFDNNISMLAKIERLMALIEDLEPSERKIKSRVIRKKKPVVEKKALSFQPLKIKTSETDYYKKNKELKKKYDKEMRDKNKAKLSAYRKEQYQKSKALQKERC